MCRKVLIMSEQFELNLDIQKHRFRVFGRNDELDLEGSEIYVCEKEEEAKQLYEKEYLGNTALKVYDWGPHFNKKKKS